MGFVACCPSHWGRGRHFPPLLVPSSLFPDVVNCMQTDNLELKKLVYLYLMNYAKSQPDLAILAVNTFAKVCHASLVTCVWGRGTRPVPSPAPPLQDCDDPNPLIRALAVRTMGCIRVDKITEYLCEPLRKCLRVRGRGRHAPSSMWR